MTLKIRIVLIIIVCFIVTFDITDSSKKFQKGKYGSECAQSCSRNCMKKKCNKTDGTCTKCKPGWKGNTCNEACEYGTWGSNCRRSCGHCKDGSTCHHVNGKCLDVCVPGFKFPRCLQECENGTYGINCSQKCSPHCVDVCNKTDGGCFCAAGWKVPYCTNECDDGRWGFGCNRTCGNCSEGRHCSKQDGKCKDGCLSGYRRFDMCDTECDDGTWGVDCKEKCGSCSEGQPCSKHDGKCKDGCLPGYQRTDACVQECENGTWDVDCNRTCGKCSEERACSKNDGKCTDGCLPGYQRTDFCKIECDNGTWGVDCKEKCGNCSEGQPCSKNNGKCKDGCLSGYQRTDACVTECDNGTWGIDCNRTCGKCSEGRQCSKQDGKCMEGCSSGYQRTDLCDTECDNGTWGNDCNRTCGKCSVGGLCSKHDGKCEDGCFAGYQMTDFCDRECENGTWGVDCNRTCGKCSEESSCSKHDGKCQEGCLPGYRRTEMCDIECEDGTWGVDCKEKCGKCSEERPCSKKYGKCKDGCSPGYYATDFCDTECINGTFGIDCNLTCGNCKDGSVCHKINGSCLTGCSDDFSGDLCIEYAQILQHNDANFTVVVYIVAVVVVVIGAVILALILIRKNSRVIKISTGGTLFSRQIEYSNNAYSNVGSNLRGPCLKEKTEHAVDISNFHAYVTSRLTNKDFFDQEFQTLPTGLIYSVNEARKPENVGKNRYKDMVAYDHSRVVLQALPNQQHFDYINANFIKGYCVDRAYIASQGPHEANLSDFWRMVWELDVRTIAMLTNLIEETKKKCIKYWPDTETSAQYGSVEILTEREHVFAEFTVRYFRVSHKESPGISRPVTQFHYTAWPDKNIPRSTSSLLQFWRKVRQNDEKKSHPWIVHCSAGVGRTGTFLAIDILNDQGKDLGYLDVFLCVRDLRDQRVNMVQTKEQYRYLHMVMVELFILPSTPVKIEEVPSVYKELKELDKRTGKTNLLMEYEGLRNEMRGQSREVNNSACDISENSRPKSTSKATENKSNENHLFLCTDVPGSSNCINAVFISSYCDANALILTPTPMTNTVVDFCCLLYDQDVKVIVTFNKDRTEQAGICFPESGSLPVGPFTICFVSEEDRETFRMRTYTCRLKDNERTVTQLIFSTWPIKAIVPTDPYKMYTFLQYLEVVKRNNDKSPVILQCVNGSDRSGLVAVLMNVLEHARFDGEVSIPQVIRHLRIRKPQIIPNFEQYKFCYDVLLCFTESNATYANI